MSLAIDLDLYLNISDIDIPELQKNKLAIAAMLFLSVPVKIFLPGIVLLDLLPSPGKMVALLCATVIAQLAPILSAKNAALYQLSNSINYKHITLFFRLLPFFS